MCYACFCIMLGLSLAKNINEHEEIVLSTLAQLQLCVILEPYTSGAVCTSDAGDSL